MTGAGQPYQLPSGPAANGMIVGQPPQQYQALPQGLTASPFATQAPAVLQPPQFDPFATESAPLPFAPYSPPPQSTPLFGNPPGQVYQGPPPMYFDNTFGNQAPATYFGQPAPWGYNNAPGNNWPAAQNAWPSQAWSRLRDEYIPRLLERPRFRQTWVYGDKTKPEAIDVLDTEIATTLNWPNFMGGTQALHISPGFIFHFWRGPDEVVTGFDLPSKAYSPYLAFDFGSDPKRVAGIETNFTIGYYSDFKHSSSDALRFTGVGLGWVQVNPYTKFKAGIEYFDRVDVKLLPAAGFFMQPNSELKLDLYFPRPKVAHRLPPRSGYEAWAYMAGEYGGGSWVIDRSGGMKDQVDINELRALAGIEWMGPRRVTGFLEGGYVFERELLYRSAPAVKLEVPETFILRLGLAF